MQRIRNTVLDSTDGSGKNYVYNQHGRPLADVVEFKDVYLSRIMNGSEKVLLLPVSEKRVGLLFGQRTGSNASL
jgi:hypothetical protein